MALNLVVITAISLIAGIGVNYLADVLPIRRKFTHPQCRSCGAFIPWIEYATNQRCGSCGNRRPVRFWVVLGVIIVYTFWMWINPPEWAAPPLHIIFGLGYIALVYMTLVMTIDIEFRLILHPVSLVGAVLALPLGLFLHGFWPTLIGGAVGFISMLGLYYLGGFFAKWMNHIRKQEVEEVALGFGDVNLAGIAGLLLGWPGIIAGLVLAILLGGLAGLLLIVIMAMRHRYQAFQAMPYAPFIISSIVILLYLKP